MPETKVLDSYEVIHHLLAAIKVVRPQLDGDGRYVVDAATHLADEWAEEGVENNETV